MRMDKLTSRFQQAIADAQSLAVGRDNTIIEPAHLLLALLDQQGGGTRPLLAQAGVNVPVLRERLAEAEAKATQMVSDALASGNVQAINYFVAQKYIEAFKALAEAPNQKFVMMPMESAGVIGSLGGIAELAKEAMERQPSGKLPKAGG